MIKVLVAYVNLGTYYLIGFPLDIYVTRLAASFPSRGKQQQHVYVWIGRIHHGIKFFFLQSTTNTTV